MAPDRPAHRSRLVVSLLLGVALLAAAFLAGRLTVAGAVAEVAPASTHTEVDVVEADIGRSITLTAVASRPTSVVAVNARPGTVTSISDATEFAVGDELYSVDAQAVRVVAGSMPFYRDLGEGTEGQDVRQLQEALRHLGHLRTNADGKFGAGTASAVEAWQRAQKVNRTGVVARGTILAVASLPTALSIDRDVLDVGRQVSGGEPAVLGTGGEPEFVMTLNDAQYRMIPADARISLSLGDRRWDAVLGDSRTNDQGMLDVRLHAPDGGVVCGADCAQIGTGETTMTAEVNLVAAQDGPSVPLAAVVTGNDGRTHVRVLEGETITEVDVTVLGVQDGVAVVDGVTVGQRVLLPEGAASSADGDEAGSTGGTTDGR